MPRFPIHKLIPTVMAARMREVLSARKVFVTRVQSWIKGLSYPHLLNESPAYTQQQHCAGIVTLYNACFWQKGLSDRKLDGLHGRKPSDWNPLRLTSAICDGKAFFQKGYKCFCRVNLMKDLCLNLTKVTETIKQLLKKGKEETNSSLPATSRGYNPPNTMLCWLHMAWNVL